MGVSRFQSKITLYPQRTKSICSIIHIQRSDPDESPFALSSTLSLASTQAPPYRLTTPSHPSQPFSSSHLPSPTPIHPLLTIHSQPRLPSIKITHTRKRYNVTTYTHTHFQSPVQTEPLAASILSFSTVFISKSSLLDTVIL